MTDAAEAGAKPVKCVVWDLDETLWEGVLLEGGASRLRSGAEEAVRTLDGRGILQSVASRNDAADALAALERFGLRDYFLYPKIHFGSKAASVEAIAKDLNIGIDALAFVDDQPFEREEVAFHHPEVLCIDAAEIASIPSRPEMNPRFVTEDSARRRRMYLDDMERDRDAEAFDGPQEAYLATLGMRFTIAPAAEADLQRAVELTERTHQLNTTGRTFDYDQLNALRRSPDHLLLVNTLEDRFGSYGRIGLTLVEKAPEVWTVRLLLMSCRVMSRGVGTVMLHYLMREARRAGVRLRADFVMTDRNRMMYVTYKFAGFREAEEEGDLVVLEDRSDAEPAFPPYVELVCSASEAAAAESLPASRG